MRKDRRVFGNNLKLSLVQNNIRPEDFARRIGCTEYNLFQIMDARLILDMDEENTIAEALNTSVNDMYVERNSNIYENAGCYECRGTFSDNKNKKLILDLFDIYCDVQEMIATENID